jgi:hypothetical protein
MAFAGLFSRRVWQRVQILLLGAILAPGQRTVTAILRIMGLSSEKHFQNFHRVLNRSIWSSREASQVLLDLLVATFAIRGTVVLGLDDTIERRRGAKIKAKGIYRDPVRSSHSHFVKASGLRWLSLMVLAPIPWAKRVWALPFLTVLAPSERYYETGPQEADGLGQADTFAGKTLAARQKAGRGDGWWLCSDRFSGSGSQTCQSDHPDRPFSAGCGVVCPGSRTPARTKRTTPQERSTLAYAGASLER